MPKTKAVVHRAGAAQFPDKERVELALELVDKARSLARALESIDTRKEDAEDEGVSAYYLCIAQRELAGRIRALTGAATQVLADNVYELGDAWAVLHG